MIEIFKSTNYDFIKYKMVAIIFSLFLSKLIHLIQVKLVQDAVTLTKILETGLVLNALAVV